ncbi:MAG: hypothetical protein V4813_12990 [Gemmatimonadota bacterium]
MTLTIRVATAVVALCLATTLRAQQVRGCLRVTDDGTALRLLSVARLSAAATEPEETEWRRAVGVPRLDSTKVVIVADVRTCAGVVAAINAYFKTPGAGRTVQVVRMDHAGFMAVEPLPAPAPGGASRAVYYISKRYRVVNVQVGI